MITDTTILPLRPLDAGQEEAIRYFYTPGSPTGLFLAAYLPVVFGLTLGSVFFTATIGLIAGASIAAGLILFRRWKIKKAIAKAMFVYRYGGEEELTFTGISSNYGFKVNGAPQQLISFTRNGRPEQVKTFSPNLVAVYSIPRQTAYSHPRYPDTVVPEGLFGLQRGKERSGMNLFLRRALVFGLPFAFVIGLTYFISGTMDSHSESHAQPDALVFVQNGRPVLASVVTSFKAYEVSNKGVYGNDYRYAEGIDLATGKQLWKVSLDGKGGGAARLLGQSSRFLFFLRDGLYVIDKGTGKVVARNNDFTAIKDRMSVAALASYEDRANYTWNDSLGAIVVKGTDGLYYTIDGLSLRTGTVDISSQDAFFENRFRYGNNYEDQITQVYDNGKQCYAFLDVQDTVALANNPRGVEGRPADQSVRRSFYSCPSDTMAAGWTALGKDVFLYGGFLVDASQPIHQPHDMISGYASYRSLAGRYNHGNAPMQTRSGAFLVMHKTTIEPTATLLLTALSANGERLWQIATGYGSVPFIYNDTSTDRLYLSGRKDGSISDDLDEVLGIDLKSGAVTRYVFR